MNEHRKERPVPGPDRHDLSDAIRPGWNQHMSLQQASATVARLARYEPAVIAELPGESILRIEVNGELAGAARCFADAPGEFSLGWAFMHGFFDPSDTIDSVTVHQDRVSLMIQTQVDVRRRRLQAVGWTDEHDPSEPIGTLRQAPFVVHADILMDIVREAFGVMARDRSRDGFVHAAAASETDIHCVARDIDTESAVAKILGWMLRDGRRVDTPMLIVRGMMNRMVVDAAGRLGVSLLATSAIPTADAFREAIGREITVLGMAASQHPGLLVDAGHVIEDDDMTDDHETGISPEG